MSLTSFFGSSCQSSNSIAGNWHSAILTNRACTKIGHLKGSTSSPEASKTLRLKAVLPFPTRPEQADGRWWNECMLMALRGGGGGEYCKARSSLRDVQVWDLCVKLVVTRP